MKVDDLTPLKEEVERKMGRKILSSSDCNSLSDDILKYTYSKISFNTLRRFFNLMKSENRPSLYTLDLLSRYCGYASFDDFNICRPKASDDFNEKHSNLLNYLILVFKNTHVTSINDITFINLVHETINYLEKYPDIIDPFQRQIAKTANGQNFYYEQFVNIDRLNSYYGKGLHYYLNENKTVRAQLFAHALLCLRSWLIMDKKGVEQHYTEVMKCEVEKTMHPFVSSRYFATQLYFADVYEDDIDAVIVKAKQFYTSLQVPEHSFQSFPFFEFILSEALVFVHQYEEAQFYIDKAIKKRAHYAPPHVHFQLFESIYLYQAITHAHIGKIEWARHIFETINTSNFYFLSKKTNFILYLSLKQFLQKNDKSENQLQYLVNQTGFRKLMGKEVNVIQMHQEELKRSY